MKHLLLLLTTLTLLAACSVTPLTEAPVTTPTATQTVSNTPVPSSTPTLRPPTATPKPVDGTLTILVNVRSGPGTSFNILGRLNADGKVQVYARDAGLMWYQIGYPSGPNGRGWVAAQYITLAEGAEIPVDATPTPSGPSGRVVQKLNVRSGPGTSFDSLGMLEAGVTVTLTGKNSTASWLRIEYASGPNGYGWVTAQYILTDVASQLPVLDDYGNVVTPGAEATDAGPLFTPTPTVGPAYADNDSPSAPGVQVSFSALGTRQFVYSSQVSAPEGDAEDWVEFTPYALPGGRARLTLGLSCSGNSALTVELWQAGAALTGWGSLACGDGGVVVTLPASLAVQMRMAPAAGEGLRLVVYTLTVRNAP